LDTAWDWLLNIVYLLLLTVTGFGQRCRNEQ
jgi:hypothetical protein